MVSVNANGIVANECANESRIVIENDDAANASDGVASASDDAANANDDAANANDGADYNHSHISPTPALRQ